MFENINQNCYLHRISYQETIQYPLLEQGYLSIGWQTLLDKSDFMNNFITNEDKNNAIESVAKILGRRKNTLNAFVLLKRGI